MSLRKKNKKKKRNLWEDFPPTDKEYTGQNVDVFSVPDIDKINLSEKARHKISKLKEERQAEREAKTQ